MGSSSETDPVHAIIEPACARDDLDLDAHEVDRQIASIELRETNGVLLGRDEDLGPAFLAAIDGIQQLLLGEAVMIAKLLTFVLEMAEPKEHTVNSFANAAFDIPVIMQKHQDGLSENIPPFPLWFDGLLHQVAGNEDLLRAPAQVVGKLLYTQLLRDTVPYAFELIKRATGEDLGTPAEVDQYSSQLVQRLEHKSGMDFAHTYMPLVLAGLIVYEQVPLKDEELLQTLRDVTEALMERDGDLTDEDEPIYEITKQIINRSAKQFGFEI